MSDDPFALLGLPRQFEIAAAQLQAAYLKRAAAHHPDRIADPIEQAEAARHAARLNDARATLADDERRANALLQLLGGPTKEQDKSLPDGFLMDMMDIRQQMEEALASNDPEHRRRLEKWALQQRQDYINTVSSLFKKAGDNTPPSDELFREIRMQLNAWRYIERMIEQLDPDYQPAGLHGAQQERS